MNNEVGSLACSNVNTHTPGSSDEVSRKLRQSNALHRFSHAIVVTSCYSSIRYHPCCSESAEQAAILLKDNCSSHVLYAEFTGSTIVLHVVQPIALYVPNR